MVCPAQNKASTTSMPKRKWSIEPVFNWLWIVRPSRTAVITIATHGRGEGFGSGCFLGVNQQSSLWGSGISGGNVTSDAYSLRDAI